MMLVQRRHLNALTEVKMSNDIEVYMVFLIVSL